MPMELNVWSGAYQWRDAPRVQELPADAVPPETKRLAELALDVAREELGLVDAVTIRWFDAESDGSRRLRERHGAKALPWHTFEADGGLQGVTFGAAPTELWIRSSLDPLDVVETVLHEARHSRQFADYLDGKDGALHLGSGSACSDQLAEVDARWWVRDVYARLEDLAEQHQADVAEHEAPVSKVATRPPAPRRDGLPSVRYERKSAAPIYGRCYDCGDRRIPIPSTSRHVCPATTGRTGP